MGILNGRRSAGPVGDGDRALNGPRNREVNVGKARRQCGTGLELDRKTDGGGGSTAEQEKGKSATSHLEGLERMRRELPWETAEESIQDLLI